MGTRTTNKKGLGTTRSAGGPRRRPSAAPKVKPRTKDQATAASESAAKAGRSRAKASAGAEHKAEAGAKAAAEPKVKTTARSGHRRSSSPAAARPPTRATKPAPEPSSTRPSKKAGTRAVAGRRQRAAREREELAANERDGGEEAEEQEDSEDSEEADPEAVEGDVIDGDAEVEEVAVVEGVEAREPAARSLARYDPLQAYLAEIRRHSLLSPEEEKDLAVKYREGGDVDAAARLVTANLRLVVKIAYEYRRAYRNILDLIQEGNIGLMQAVKKFDPYRGVKLSSYAAWWIRAYILRFILNNWRMVKIGTTQTQRKLFFNLSKEQARLSALGIEPTSERVADRLGVEQRDVEEMDKRMRATDLSLDAPVSDEGDGRGTSRLELTPSQQARADDVLAVSQFNEDLSKHLSSFGSTLEGRELYIFQHRLMTEAPMTLQQIGDEFQLSRERVRQIERRLLQKLRAFLLENMGEHFDIQPGP